jgi:hypothetical protein
LWCCWRDHAAASTSSTSPTSALNDDLALPVALGWTSAEVIVLAMPANIAELRILIRARHCSTAHS